MLRINPETGSTLSRPLIRSICLNLRQRVEDLTVIFKCAWIEQMRILYGNAFKCRIYCVEIRSERERGKDFRVQWNLTGSEPEIHLYPLWYKRIQNMLRFLLFGSPNRLIVFEILKFCLVYDLKMQMQRNLDATVKIAMSPSWGC